MPLHKDVIKPILPFMPIVERGREKYREVYQQPELLLPLEQWPDSTASEPSKASGALEISGDINFEVDFSI